MHDVGRGKFRVGINPTIQSLNVGYLGELHDYGQQLNIEVCPENIVKSPPRYNPLNLPTKIKKYYIEKLKQYKFSTVNGVLESPEGDHQMFKALLDKLKNMDKSRGTNFLNLWPEFEEYC
jgi:hypothetical protein